MELERIIDLGYELGMTQERYEITEAASFLKREKINSFLEIGTDRGGTFLVWSKILEKEDGVKISIDWAHGPWGNNQYNIEERDKTLKSIGGNVKILNGDSHSEKIRDQLKKVLNGNKVDFLFIDGDHSYTGVKLDYYMYKDFVKTGGWIGFHDIKNTEFHRKSGCYVDLFWEEINIEKVWFFADQVEYGGIGMMKKLDD